jgi:hypothetical protein
MEPYRRAIPILQPVLYHPSSLYSSSQLPFKSPMLGVLSIRKFVTSSPRRSTNFDTLKVVQRLEAQGFTPEQSKAVMELLRDVIDESIRGLSRTMITREEQDKVPRLKNNTYPCFRLYINKKSISHN